MSAPALELVLAAAIAAIVEFVVFVVGHVDRTIVFVRFAADVVAAAVANEVVLVLSVFLVDLRNCLCLCQL